jgi:hypothetical protein
MLGVPCNQVGHGRTMKRGTFRQLLHKVFEEETIPILDGINYEAL